MSRSECTIANCPHREVSSSAKCLKATALTKDILGGGCEGRQFNSQKVLSKVICRDRHLTDRSWSSSQLIPKTRFADPSFVTGKVNFSECWPNWSSTLHS